MAMRTDRLCKSQQQLGVRIRELRLARGWSQEHLADTSDLSRAHIGRVESGRSDVQLLTLLRLAKGLGVPLHCVAKGIGSH